jgi:signal transduction histidine kinase
MNGLKSGGSMNTRTAVKERNGAKNAGKTKEDLLSELAELHKRIAELEGLKRGENVVNNAALGKVAVTDAANRALRGPDGKGSLFIHIQEQERKRIANELHDVMGHTLTAIKLSMESIVYKGKNTQNKKMLMDIIGMIKNANEEVHQIIYALRPPLLDDIGLLATISWFCRNTENACPWIFIEQEIDIQEDEISDYLRIVIFRILQESMNNIIKHSEGDRVRLGLNKKNGLIQLSIEDNGMGFNPEELRSESNDQRGLGLINMKERTELSEGSFSITSTVGSGTTVRCTWPCGDNSMAS